MKYRILERNQPRHKRWFLSIKQGVLEGNVIDSGDNEPMIGVMVAIESTTTGVITDVDDS